MSTVRRRSIFLSAIDPKSQVHLKLEDDLFDATESGADIPIGASAGTPFYNLQIRGKLFDSNEFVLEDGTNNSVVAVVERKNTTIGYTFFLYSKRPAFPGQARSNIMKYNVDLYDFAKVTDHNGILKVVKEGEDQAKYTLQSEGANYVIMREGTKVATMSPNEGEFYNLDINEGVDPCLLICLASIADEMKKKKKLYDL